MFNWKKYDKLFTLVKNKYILSAILFLVWISFFDSNNLISRYKYNQELNDLIAKKEYYKSEIEKNKADMHALMSNRNNLEKFARETYLMKKDDEEIFIIIRDEGEE
jgi:cell division protein FtsB